MTPLTHTPSAAPAADSEHADRASRFLRRAGGAALIAAPVLVLGGMLACPPQDSDSTADYITSLARDTFLTELSAMLLHYGLIAGGLGALTVPGLIRGRKGRGLAVFGALATAVSVLNVSGAVRDDWWRMIIGQQLPRETAVRISDAVDASSFIPLWSGTEPLAFLGLLALCVALARAGVVGWWLTAVYVGAFVAMMFIPIHLTYVVGVAFTMLFLPLGVAGVRIFQRDRVAV
ncbi:hypothetical protein FHS43_000355 [Streptosporangium becharense]|uniref:DUF4386 domain-containing protein n=1 Tax=Streptosporangium becharense TaxID=1816182 RepID=A0A7W9IFP5_9ACTN|nr:hypothetical protein [Streptosporangium becharense]MBB2909109.1 hypothetical protein [Streptosporangium becharense]MBB5819872.1 hypothetical protein [Streptosporangium becharense]